MAKPWSWWCGGDVEKHLTIWRHQDEQCKTISHAKGESGDPTYVRKLMGWFRVVVSIPVPGDFDPPSMRLAPATQIGNAICFRSAGSLDGTCRPHGGRAGSHIGLWVWAKRCHQKLENVAVLLCHDYWGMVINPALIGIHSAKSCKVHFRWRFWWDDQA